MEGSKRPPREGMNRAIQRWVWPNPADARPRAVLQLLYRRFYPVCDVAAAIILSRCRTWSRENIGERWQFGELRNRQTAGIISTFVLLN